MKKTICAILCSATLAEADPQLRAVPVPSVAMQEVSRKYAYLERKPDLNGNTYDFPHETLNRGGGDCEDLAFLYSLELSKIGVANTIVVGDYITYKGREPHMWLETAVEDNKNLIFDVAFSTDKNNPVIISSDSSEAKKYQPSDAVPFVKEVTAARLENHLKQMYENTGVQLSYEVK